MSLKTSFEWLWIMRTHFAIVNHLMKIIMLLRSFWYTYETATLLIRLGPCRFVRIDTMSHPIPVKSSPVTLAFRIRVVMAERGIRSVAALQRMLKAIGVDISVPQLIRIVDGQSTHVSTVVLGGLIAVLQCGIEDLIAVALPANSQATDALVPAY